MKLFNPDSRIMIFLSRVADLVILNILWLVCCIPVVTIGASTTAMYHVIRHWQKDSVSSVVRDFFQSFKEDFKQATPVYLILLIPTAAVVMNAMLIFNPENSAAVPSYLLVIWFISALILLFISSFVYPVMAFFADSIFKTLRNAMVLALANLPRTILISILNLLPVILLFVNLSFFLQSSIFWLLIGGALVAYLNMSILKPVFKKLVPSEFEDTVPDTQE
ncbi:MAG: YesL family protein [Firmicutes bacterium]|nr:YesL family protein [Bacillota bacterium]MDY2807584.1 YesL family protein [Oscillospiraceae bacterium]